MWDLLTYGWYLKPRLDDITKQVPVDREEDQQLSLQTLNSKGLGKEEESAKEIKMQWSVKGKETLNVKS
jgi:hypothetical protein